MIKSILQKLGLGNGDETPEVVSINVSEDVIRQKMTESRDFRMTISAAGDLSAFCKTCEAEMFIAQDEMLIWFHCKGCKRFSFNPPGNVSRDTAFAVQDGKPLEYEAFFIDFPPQLQPPTVFESVLFRTNPV